MRGMAGSGARRRLSGRGACGVGEGGGGQCHRSIFGFARLLVREHGRREGSRGDGPRARCRRVVVGPKREAFRRRIVDAGDDKAQFLDRLHARTGK